MGGPLRAFAGLCRAARERLRAAVAANLPAEQAALLDGLLFGDTSRLPPETVRDFRRSGVFHILAVSGSNVAFVAGGFWLFARPFLGVLGLRGRRREAVLWPATALVLAGYAVMTGLGPSVVRATLMAEAGLLYLWLGRRRDVTGPLCLAALVMLCRRPLIILDPGFQLSYAATLGILYIYPHLWRRGRRSGGSGRIASVVLQAVLVSAAAQAAVAPVLAWHFGEVSLAGLLANAAVVPLSGLALTAGLGAGLISCLAGAAAGPVGQALAAPAFAAASVLLRLMAGSAGVFASLPLASVITGRPALWGVVLYYLALVWVVRGAGRDRAGRRVLLCVLVAVAAGTGAAAADAVAGALAARGGGSPGLEVVFLDVGQGDSVLVLFPGGKSLLVDGGPAGAGERVVLPYLRWRGVRRIDWVVVSHLHDDHIGGLVEVVADPSLAVGEVVVAAGGFRCGEERTPMAEALLEAVRARGIPVREVRPGDRLVSPEGVTAAVLWPPAGGLGAGARQAEGYSPSSLENDRSLVLRLVSGPASFLLPGDLEETGERALLAFLGEAGGRVLGRPARSGGGGPAAPSSGTGALDVLVLKVGHHGSANATSEEFLAAVTPACAVVCAGPNPFGHPAPETLSRLKEAGTVVFVTRDDGAVTFDVRGRVVCVRTFLSGRRFEWPFAPEGAARAGDEGLAGLVT
ncbi:MAG TPA: hypothetical protein DGR79_07295 [Clostridiales bacterium]|nr:hypothetical protein [Clostridiales bacterium]